MARISIARMMMAVGISSLATFLMRGWSGPENWFGLLGLLGFALFVTMVGWTLTIGRPRRFCNGAIVTGLLLGFVLLARPNVIIEPCRDQLILPIDRWKIGSYQGMTRLEMMFLWCELGEEPGTWSGSPAPSKHRWDVYRGQSGEVQVLLAIPLVVVMMLGGSLAAISLPRLRPQPPSLDPPP